MYARKLENGGNSAKFIGNMQRIKYKPKFKSPWLYERSLHYDINYFQ